MLLIKGYANLKELRESFLFHCRNILFPFNLIQSILCGFFQLCVDTIFGNFFIQNFQFNNNARQLNISRYEGHRYAFEIHQYT